MLSPKLDKCNKCHYNILVRRKRKGRRWFSFQSPWTDTAQRGLETKGFILISVLDHGYIKLVNNMGSDIDVVNSARVSYDKEVSSLGEKDESLINFLVKHRHDSTLRHCAMTFEVYAPLMVARQWYKHAVGSSHLDDQLGWNESSRRYITEKEEFYIPHTDEWRSAPENSKQGSGEPLPRDVGAKHLQRLRASVNRGIHDYEDALKDGVAPEQARLLLPAYAMYVRWRWTASLNAVLHFVSLRTGHGAQSEIVDYANAVNDYVLQYYPMTAKAWNEHRT
jgi:thymidylate synthase (FAD)